MYRWLKKYIDPVIPLFSIIPLISCFALNMLVYSGTMILCADWYHYDLTTRFDNMIPLVSEWMYIYFGCYIFWIANYVMAARINRDHEERFYRFVTADMMSRLVCAAFYIGLPTTNVRPEVVVDSFSDWLVSFLYGVDQPTNLFPSIHCLVSWLCFAAIRSSDRVPRWYKVFSLVFALLVPLSTLYTKQHYIVDGIAGIALAEALFDLNRKINAYRTVQHFFGKLNCKLYKITKGEHCEQQS